MNKKKVLFVAYHFPPLSIGGSYRPFKFVKYLKLNSDSIEPMVLSLSPESYKHVFEKYNYDESSYQILQNLKVKLFYAKSNRLLKKWWFINFIQIYFNVFKGSEAQYWKSSFKKIFPKILKEEKIDLVMVTCPPFSIGNLVRKELKKSDIPLITDMRDNWSLWLSHPHGSRLHYIVNRYFERKMYSKSEVVLGVTNEQIRDLKSVFRKGDKKFNVIPNSFSTHIQDKIPYGKTKDKLIIGYSGSFYFDPAIHMIQSTPWWKRRLHRKFYYWPRKELWIYRSPFYFFKLVNRLKTKHPEITIEIKFAGNYPPWLNKMIKEFALDDTVEIKGYLSGEALEKFYRSCDLMLVTSVKVQNGKDYCIASKVFDYMEHNRKILGVVSEGAQKTFLEKLDSSIVIDADNLDGNLNELIKFAKSTNIEIEYNRKYLEQFNLEMTGSKLEQLILEHC